MSIEPDKNKSVAKVKAQLPQLSDLSFDIEAAFKNDQLNLLLNQDIPPTWLKDHPSATKEIEVQGNKIRVPVQYITVERVEFMLTRIFQLWRLEVLDFKVMFQSVAVHVRLHYQNPVNGQWSYQDGLGAVGVQTDKGKAASDLAAIKQDAIMKALPAAESYALKDAAEKLGKLFGKDLNRKDALAFVGAYAKDETVTNEQLAYLYDAKEDKLSKQERADALRIITNKETNSYNKLFKILSEK